MNLVDQIVKLGRSLHELGVADRPDLAENTVYVHLAARAPTAWEEKSLIEGAVAALNRRLGALSLQIHGPLPEVGDPPATAAAPKPEPEPEPEPEPVASRVSRAPLKTTLPWSSSNPQVYCWHCSSDPSADAASRLPTRLFGRLPDGVGKSPSVKYYKTSAAAWDALTAAEKAAKANPPKRS